jgi:hypothetical protein
MPEDIQECMRTLIVQHGSVLAALATLQQHPKAQHNDEQTNSLKSHFPNINAPTKFNHDMSKFTREHCNRL